MRAAWDQLVVDSDACPGAGTTEAAANSDDHLSDFVAACTTAEDQCNFVQELRNRPKPHELWVQLRWCKKGNGAAALSGAPVLDQS